MKNFIPSLFGWLVVALALLPVGAILIHSLQFSNVPTGRDEQLAQVGGEVIKEDLVPPTVNLTAPASGASLGGVVTASADASDNIGVASVALYQNGNLIGSDPTAPYSVIWDTGQVSNGAYSLTARATDVSGNQTTSGAVSVTVNNVGAPPPPPPPPTNSSTDPNHLADNNHILFVDKNNSSCSDGGSRSAALNPSTPWCRPTGMDENSGRKFQPGDIIYVKAGDYSIAPLTLYSAGSSGQPIIWKPYPGDAVTIRGNGNQSSALITFQAGADYWTIDSLNFTDDSAFKLLDVNRGRGLTVRNSKFGPIRQNNASVIRLSGGSADALFDNNDIFCFNVMPASPTATAATDGLQLDNVQNSVVRNNRFGDCGHVSLSLGNAVNNLIERNTIQNQLHTAVSIVTNPDNPGSATGNIFRQNLVRNYNSNPSYPSLPGHGLSILYASGNLIYNNIFTGGANGATGLSIGVDPNQGQANNNRVFNNTFYQTGGRGIELAHFGSNGTTNGITGNKIYNNIIVNTDNSSSRNAPVALTFYNFEENNGYGNEIKNNLLVGGDGVLVKSRGQGAVLRFSYTAATLNATTFASSNLGADPQFASTGTSFPLSATSPAGNTGWCQSEVSTDYNGNPRPSTGCDIGAFESVFGVAVPPPPPEDLCGNGVLNAGEQCDGASFSLGSACAIFGFTSGALRCDTQCRYIVSQCIGTPVATTTLLVSTTTPQIPFLPLLPLPPKPPKVTPVPVKPVTGPDATKPPVTPAKPSGCQERWFCRGEWSECVDGQQTRDCTELSHCGTTNTRPPIERACSGLVGNASPSTATSAPHFRLNFTPEQNRALAVLIPTFFATLAALVTVIIRLWL